MPCQEYIDRYGKRHVFNVPNSSYVQVMRVIDIMEDKMSETRKEKIINLLYESFPWSADIQDQAKKAYCKEMAERILTEIVKK